MSEKFSYEASPVKFFSVIAGAPATGLYCARRQFIDLWNATILLAASLRFTARAIVMPSRYRKMSLRLSRDIRRLSVLNPGSCGNAVSVFVNFVSAARPESLGFSLVDSCFGGMVRGELGSYCRRDRSFDYDRYR